MALAFVFAQQTTRAANLMQNKYVDGALSYVLALHKYTMFKCETSVCVFCVHVDEHADEDDRKTLAV